MTERQKEMLRSLVEDEIRLLQHVYRMEAEDCWNEFGSLEQPTARMIQLDTEREEYVALLDSL